MPPPDFAQAVRVGLDILSSTLSTLKSTILLQTGDVKSGVVECDNVELWGPPGVFSRPAAPTQGKAACQALVLSRGDRDICFGTRDTRAQAIYGNLAAGETCVCETAQLVGRLLCKADGSVSRLTTDDLTPTGNTVFDRIAPDGWRVFGPWGTQWQNASGYHMRTWHGVKVDATGLGLPAPFDVYKSAYKVSADIIELDAAVMVLGRENGNRQPIALATGVLATNAAIVAALNLIATALTTFVPGSGLAAIPGAAAAAAACATAASAVATSLQPSTPATPNPLVIAGVTSAA